MPERKPYSLKKPWSMADVEAVVRFRVEEAVESVRFHEKSGRAHDVDAEAVQLRAIGRGQD